MTDTITRERVSTTPQTSHGGNGDHDAFAHYVSKADLERYYFDGVPTTALCGKRWSPSKDPKSLPVCPECKEKWEAKEPGIEPGEG